MNVREEGPAFSEDKDELEAIIVEDVMDLANCQFWADRTDTELEEWYNWYHYVANYNKTCTLVQVNGKGENFLIYQFSSDFNFSTLDEYPWKVCEPIHWMPYLQHLEFSIALIYIA